MYTRVPTFQISAEKIDAAISHFRDVTVPELRKLPGFEGATLLVSREKGMTRAIVRWDSRQTLDSSLEATKGLRAEYTEKFGADLVSLEEFEVAVEV
jgi:heme-degrading monooxygenase HmoA